MNCQKDYESTMKQQITPLGEIRRINSTLKARKYLGLSQSQLGRAIQVDQAIISKVEHGKIRYSTEQVNRLAVLVALEFRKRIGRSDLGLWAHYNSPLTFTVGGICYAHGKRGFEYVVKRATDRCPKCKRKGI